MSNQVIKFQLSGLHCESCKKITEKRVGKIEGVTGVNTDIGTGEMMVSAEREITKNEVVTALSGTDYKVN